MLRPAAVLLALALAGCATSGPNAPALSPDRLKADVAILASDAYEGRAPASAGEQKTLGYMIAQMADAGLKPGHVGAWLQPLPLVQAEATNAPALTITGADGAKSYAYRDGHVSWTKRLEPSVSLVNLPMVFVGYGIVAPEKGWNDYAKADVKGKVAVILVNDADFDPAAGHALFGGRAMTWYGRWPYKFEEAARQGAAGALVIHETAPAAYPWAVVQSSWTGPQFDMVRADRGASRALVEGWISSRTAADLFKRASLDFEALKAAAQKPGFTAVPIPLTASMTIETRLKETQSSNFVAMLPGAERPDEVVLFTAHFDHLGRCVPIEGDDICNGAQDNATGVAGLLEIARAMAAQGPAKRTLAFVGFGAEEQGLLGSAYYADQPSFPLAKTVAAINMDGWPAIPPARDMTVVGFGKSQVDEDLAALAAKQGRTVRGEAFPERGGYYRSDHFNLAKGGVPAIFPGRGVDLIEGGEAAGKALIEDYTANRYHKPSDEFDPAWDFTGVAQDLSLLRDLGRAYADGTAWPTWKPDAEFKAVREATEAQRAVKAEMVRPPAAMTAKPFAGAASGSR